MLLLHCAMHVSLAVPKAVVRVPIAGCRKKLLTFLEALGNSTPDLNPVEYHPPTLHPHSASDLFTTLFHLYYLDLYITY